MISRTPVAPVKKKIKRRQSIWRRIVVVLAKLLISPLVLLADCFRRKGTLDNSWLYAFFLFTTVVIGLTGIGIIINDVPLFKTLRMISTQIESREILSGDLQPIIKTINKCALKYNIDPNLIYAVIKSESNFQPLVVSRAGARGLMQLMPEVWREYNNGSACKGNHKERHICHQGDCIFDPDANIDTGVRYLRELLDRYQGRVDLALEAYNAGISNVKPGKTPKFSETRAYIRRTLTSWQDLRKFTIDQQLKLSIRLQHGLKWLFGVTCLCWVILFCWANRKLFRK
jgi:hypothetical protein